jgi:antitoxin component YwqK of YwqJK toxin-antitoxin module
MSVNVEETDRDTDGCLLYGGAPYTGEVVETAPDGRVISQTSYFQGFEDGPAREWHPNGAMRLEGQSRYGVGAVGVWREWYPDGRPAAEQGFDDDGRQLYVRRWDASGAVLEDTTYQRH